MPVRNFMRRRRQRLGGIVDSNKNVFRINDSTGVTLLSKDLVITVDSAANTVSNEVERGCKIFGVNLKFDVCGLAGTGVKQQTIVYLIKNPGNNLTVPGPFAVDTSNEKKFVMRMWSFMTMRNQDGNVPNIVDEYVKIPRIYQRFGADDTLELVYATDTAAGHINGLAIYKWFK